MAILGGAWQHIIPKSSPNSEETEDFWGAVFMTFQVLLTGGHDPTIVHFDERVVYALTIGIGLIVVSVLIGIVSDSVGSFMRGLAAGTSKVVEEGHTLILGWNEATTRAVCQIVFLRRAFLVQNETWSATLLPWTRARPSTVVACRPVVVLSGGASKQAMASSLEAAFRARNISPWRTRLGKDVVLRFGDPTSAHDLVRVAAHRAAAVLVMMTEADAREAAADPGSRIPHSATLRTVLALRNVVFSNGAHLARAFNPDLRVVVQLSDGGLGDALSGGGSLGESGSVGGAILRGCSLPSPEGRDCLFAQDVTAAADALLFGCCGAPCLSRVVMGLLDFQGDAVRSRLAGQLFAGKAGALGWCVGKSARSVMLHHGWANGVFLGVVDGSLSAGDLPVDGCVCALSRGHWGCCVAFSPPCPPPPSRAARQQAQPCSSLTCSRVLTPFRLPTSSCGLQGRARASWATPTASSARRTTLSSSALPPPPPSRAARTARTSPPTPKSTWGGPRREAVERTRRSGAGRNTCSSAAGAPSGAPAAAG